MFKKIIGGVKAFGSRMMEDHMGAYSATCAYFLMLSFIPFIMICSIEELGSSREFYPEAPEGGIYIFPEDTKVGADAIEELGLHDAVVEYEITSNRVDCYSVIGIAREAAATFDKTFLPPDVKATGNDEDVNNYVKVEVRDPDLCRRYCARVVKNVKIAPSPKWMQRCLASNGIRPINNIVDITNYVMIRFEFDGIFEEILDQLGQMPLPPYIKHQLQDKTRYNTVYAKYDGSAAAPTAGLHFTKELLEEIKEQGVNIAHGGLFWLNRHPSGELRLS